MGSGQGGMSVCMVVAIICTMAHIAQRVGAEVVCGGCARSAV